MPSQTRRQFLRRAGTRAIGAMAASSLSRVLPAQREREKAGDSLAHPNVLLIMCDQLNASVLSCYGGPVPTPHIDRIAAEGVRFDGATCPTPFCSPTRASIITGMYPHAHGITTNVGRLVRPERPGQQGICTTDITTERILHEAGYATNHYGKWHIWQDDLPYYPDMYRPALEYAREMAPVFERVRERDRSRWMEWYNWSLPVDVAPEYREAVRKVSDRWSKVPYADFIGKMGRLELPLAQNFDARVADLCVERIKANRGKPFMLTASFNAPHDPNVVPSPYYDTFDPNDVELPVNRHRHESRFLGQWSRQVIADLGEVGMREFLRVYYGMVKMIDDQVGRILQTLRQTGQLDNTLIVFTADHGDMAGGHGMVWKSTDAFYDEVARVPLLFRYPSRFGPAVSNIAADLVDLMPTLLELTGQPLPGQSQGQSLVPFLTGQRDASEARPFSFSQRVGRNKSGQRKVLPGTVGHFMIRGQGYKYVRYHKGDEYLYNLTDDPGELENLAADPKYRQTRTDLAAEMNDWLKRTNWPG